MNSLLSPGRYFRAPDGTEVAELLNAATSPGITGDFSLALGRLAPGTISAVHFHPLVTQLTCVTSGRLVIWMREPEAQEPHQVYLRPGAVAVTKPRTLLQLRNESSEPAATLYIVNPGYLRVADHAGNLTFDDAVIAGPSWDRIDPDCLDPERLRIFAKRRAEIERRG